MSTWYERLKEVRENNELTQPELGDKIGKDGTAISRYENGKGAVFLPFKLKKSLDKVFTKNEVEYIEEGEMSESRIEASVKSTLSQVSVDDSIVIEYRSNAIGGCGSGQAVEQVDHKWLTFSKQLLRGIVQTDRIDELHMIDSFGNSMEPTIKSGEKLFVLPFEKEGFHIREGSVYIIFFAHGVMVKRIYFDKVSGGLKLSGDNKSVSPEEIYTQDELEALTIYGRVVGHMGSMG